MSLGACLADLQVSKVISDQRNTVLKGGDPARRVVIRPGSATTCGNAVEGEKPDQPC